MVSLDPQPLQFQFYMSDSPVPQNVTAFGDGVSNETMKLRRGH